MKDKQLDVLLSIAGITVPIVFVFCSLLVEFNFVELIYLIGIFVLFLKYRKTCHKS